MDLRCEAELIGTIVTFPVIFLASSVPSDIPLKSQEMVHYLLGGYVGAAVFDSNYSIGRLFMIELFSRVYFLRMLFGSVGWPIFWAESAMA